MWYCIITVSIKYEPVIILGIWPWLSWFLNNTRLGLNLCRCGLAHFKVILRDVAFLALRINNNNPTFLITFFIGNVYHFVLGNGQLVRILSIEIVKNSCLFKTFCRNWFGVSFCGRLFVGDGLFSSFDGFILGLLWEGCPIVFGTRRRRCGSVTPACPIVGGGGFRLLLNRGGSGGRFIVPTSGSGVIPASCCIPSFWLLYLLQMKYVLLKVATIIHFVQNTGNNMYLLHLIVFTWFFLISATISALSSSSFSISTPLGFSSLLLSLSFHDICVDVFINGNSAFPESIKACFCLSLVCFGIANCDL